MKTKAEKQLYFAELRANWKRAKAALTEGKASEIQAIIATHGLKISVTGYMVVSMQMRAQGLDGIPYLDAKTYQGWIENGYRVRKGEKSSLSGITWIDAGHKDGDEASDDKKGFVFPKAYHLFHRSQVEAIAEKQVA